MAIFPIHFFWRGCRIALGLGVLVCGVFADSENLITNPGLELAEAFDWFAAGRKTAARRSKENPHRGSSCLYVIDEGDQGGQGNNPFFTAKPGYYYAEAWLRTDAKLQQTAVFDIQFFDANRRYLRSVIVGSIRSTAWTRVAAFLVVPREAALVRLRVMPTPAGQNALHGACYADDFYLAPRENARAAGRVTLPYRKTACLNDDPDGRTGQVPPDLRVKRGEPKAQIDFENLAGWTLKSFGQLEGTFCRSREHPLRGKYVGKFSYRTGGRAAWVSLRPPAPIPLEQSFDAVRVWCHGDWHRARSGPEQQMVLVLVAHGTERTIVLPPFTWPYWSIAHKRLERPTQPGAKIVEIRILNLSTRPGQSRTVFFDELSFHQEPKGRVNLQMLEGPEPTRVETIQPLMPGPVRNEVKKEGSAIRFLCQSESGIVEFIYKPRTGTLDDLEVKADEGRAMHPCQGGGPAFDFKGAIRRPGEEGVEARLLELEVRKDAARVLWRYSFQEDSATVSWQMQARGKSLVFTVDSVDRNVSQWFYGRPSDGGTRQIDVPFLTHHCGAGPVWLAPGPAFIHCQPDWFVSRASVFQEDNCEYVPLIGAQRNAFHERLFLSVSSDFREVLPSIPNPPSPVARVLGSHVYVNISGSLHDDGLERCLWLWKQMKGLGMDKIIVKHHAHTWSTHSGRGNEPFVQTVRAAGNIPGGDRALADYIARVKKLGYEYFLYTDYCIVAPVNRHFEESLVGLGPTGQWKRGWYQYYALTPLMAPVLAARLAPQLEKKYGLTGSYCDQHTAAPPSRWVDYDPRKPGAGMLQTVFRAYCKVFDIERKAYRGPVVSEGGNYWIYAGRVDGSYAQLRTAGGQARWQVPFLVDFDLLKIHPLEVDVGMGWRGSYGYDPHAKDWNDALDRFLCANIAFGHSGILYSPNFAYVSSITKENPLGKWKRSAVRTYFMIQQLAARYAMVPVDTIRYWDGKRLLGTSAALVSGAFRESQVAVRYTNALFVFVNGSFHRGWKVNHAGREYELPPHGWLAVQGDDFLEYSALLNGHRVDYARSPVYTFADGRSKPTDFGDIKATDAVIVLHDRNDEKHQINSPMWK